MLNASSEVQRGQEAELIFIGEATVKAIRFYKQRTGRYPSALKELIGIRSRIIRKLYKDPMTIGDPIHREDWDLILLNQYLDVEGIEYYGNSVFVYSGG